MVEGPDCLSPGRSQTVGAVPGESHGNRAVYYVDRINNNENDKKFLT